MKPPLRAFCLALAAALLCSGCATNGYISSVITTGIGLDVSENPQTQIPHVRFGYIRNGVYYIPTGKTGNLANGDVTQTPTVVSKIHVSSKFLEGITISEKFAVGEEAVDSSGARQLFADVSTESRGTVMQAPIVAPAGGGGRFAGAVVRTQATGAVPEQKIVVSNRVQANKLNGDIGALNNDTADAVLVVARNTNALKDDFATHPQGDKKGKSYLFHLVQETVKEPEEGGRTKLKAWRGIIPVRPKSPPKAAEDGGSALPAGAGAQ